MVKKENYKTPNKVYKYREGDPINFFEDIRDQFDITSSDPLGNCPISHLVYYESEDKYNQKELL